MQRQWEDMKDVKTIYICLLAVYLLQAGGRHSGERTKAAVDRGR